MSAIHYEKMQKDTLDLMSLEAVADQKNPPPDFVFGWINSCQSLM